MPKTGSGSQKAKVKTQGLYDRIADVHNLSMKLNGYRASVAKYLRSLDLTINADSLVLDVFAPVRDDWVRGDDGYLRGRRD